MSKSIFMIGWEFPPHNSGGLGVACQGLTRGLQSIGQPVVFALPQVINGGGSTKKVIYQFPDDQQSTDQSANDQQTSNRQTMEMVLVNSVLQPYWRQPNISESMVVDMVEESKNYGKVVAEVAEEYKKTTSLLHAHDWMSIPAGLRAREKVGKPLVLQIHSTEFDRAGGGRPNQAIADVEWQGMTEADKVIAVSHYTKQLIIDKYNIPADKIEVVHNGIDPNPDFHNQPLMKFLGEKPLILFVGRLTIQKGPEYFLSVARRVLEKDRSAVFVLAGQGDMYQSLLVSSAYQGLSGSVLFAGFLRGKEKQQLYQRADVFVMPSVSEPFGIAALEAALSETPVIISKNAGVNEVLPHAHPIDFWDTDKMASTILELISQPEKRRAQAQQVKAEAQNQGWRQAAAKIQRIYEELLG